MVAGAERIHATPFDTFSVCVLMTDLKENFKWPCNCFCVKSGKNKTFFLFTSFLLFWEGGYFAREFERRWTCVFVKAFCIPYITVLCLKWSLHFISLPFAVLTFAVLSWPSSLLKRALCPTEDELLNLIYPVWWSPFSPSTAHTEQS